jgi:hypothetical protein
MPPEALESIFVQRQELAKQILERIRTCAFKHRQQHTIVTGPRGIGKTHLISLIYYRLRAMEDLRAHMLMAWLREEEWEVTSFLDLLMRILHALASEPEGNVALAQRIQSLYNLTPERAESAALQILKELVHGKTLLILTENMDEMLQRLGPDGKNETPALPARTSAIRDPGLQPDPRG